MAVNIANSPFDINEYMRRLGMNSQSADPAAASNPDPVPSTGYDPYASSPAPSASTSAGLAQDSSDPGSWQNPRNRTQDGYDPNPESPPDRRNDPSDPNSTPKSAKTCPPGYEWEDGGPNYPNGRCKVPGTNWDDGCWIDTDGTVYCKDNPKPQSGQSQGQNQAPAPSSSPAPKAAQANYAFNLQSLMDLLGPSYQALLAQIKAGTNPYDPSTIEALVGNRKVAAERQKLDQQRQLQSQRSAAGMGTQGATQQDLRSIGANADIASASDINTIRENAIKANYAAQVQRIDQQIQTLNSHASFVLGLASSDSQRQSAQLQYAAQLNSLQAARQNLELQLQAELDRLKLQLLLG